MVCNYNKNKKQFKTQPNLCIGVTFASWLWVNTSHCDYCMDDLRRGWIQSCLQIWCANKKPHNRYMSSQMPRWLTSAFFGNVIIIFFHSDITSCKFFALACSASSCMWGADERWWRGVCSTASRSIDGAQPTHSCADEESPRLIIQRCPPRFGRTQPGGDGEVKKKREGWSVGTL